MSVYSRRLPLAFPLFAVCSEQVAAEICHILVMSDKNTRNGSSFAVTSDVKIGYRCVWLSKISATIVRKRIPNLIIQNSVIKSFGE